MKDGAPFAFAGLWERWDKGKEPIVSCTIIVTDANELCAKIHDRMPVILPPEQYDAWLTCAAGVEALRQYPAKLMRAYPVSTRVGSPKNDDASIIEPIEAAPL